MAQAKNKAKKAASRLSPFKKKPAAPAQTPKTKKTAAAAAPVKAKKTSGAAPARAKKTSGAAAQPKNKNALLALGAAGIAALGFGAYKVISGRRDAADEEARAEEVPAEASPAKKKPKKREKISGKRLLLLVMGACCLFVFCFSGYKIVSELWESHKEAQAFEDLTDFFGPDYTPVPVTPTQPSATSPAGTGPTEPGATAPSQSQEPVPPGSSDRPTEPVAYRFSKYDDLYAMNNDMFGWISIDGTNVNYPVMHTPKDPEYYLRRGFDKKSARSGTPFLSGKCYAGCGNYIVYGHRMNNGSMFRDLLNYEKRSFWEAHPIIHFDLVTEPGDYAIIAAFYSRVYAVNEQNVFRYYNYTDLTNESVFNEFMTQVYASARYKTGVTAEYGDQLLTLSTCSYHVDNGRFVVVAKRIS